MALSSINSAAYRNQHNLSNPSHDRSESPLSLPFTPTFLTPCGTLREKLSRIILPSNQFLKCIYIRGDSHAHLTRGLYPGIITNRGIFRGRQDKIADEAVFI